MTHGALSGPRSSARTGVAALVGGAAFGQFLIFAITPWLTRLYEPTAFGAFSVASAIALVMAAGLSGRLEFAIPLPKDQREARNLLDVSVTIATLLTCVFLVLFLYSAEQFAQWLSAPEFALMAPLIPLIAFSVALFSILNQWAMRLGHYRLAAGRNVAQAAGTASFQLGGGLAGVGPAGLLAGLGFGQAVGTLMLLPALRGTTFRGSTFERLHLAKRYRHFVLLLAPSGVINSLSLYLPVSIIGGAYGVAAAGLYGLTIRVLNGPLGIIGIAAGQVYGAEFARSRRETGAAPMGLFIRATTWLLLLSASFACVVALFGPWAFGKIFGEGWSQSGEIARILIFAVSLQLIVSPLTTTLSFVGKVKTQATWELLRSLSIIASLLVPVIGGVSLIGTLSIYSFVSGVSYAACWGLCFAAIRRTRI